MNVKQGRPIVGMCQKIAPDILARIKALKGEREEWGAKSIWYELVHREGYNPSQLPGISTIKRYLSAEGLVKSYERARPLSDNKAPSTVSACHERWQIDDMGAEEHLGIGHVIMMNIKDVKSNVYVGSEGKAVKHGKDHVNTKDYKDLLRKAFVLRGLPKEIQADHGNLFYENHSKSPFPTNLHLWLLGLGIELKWSRVYRPTDQAKVERCHRTLNSQMKKTTPYNDIKEFNKSLQDRLLMWNQYIPCDTFKQPPLVAFPEAVHSGRGYEINKEKELFSIEAIANYLQKQVWYRKVASNRTISLGGHVYYIPNAKPKQELTITFDAKTLQLQFHYDNKLIVQKALIGLDFESIAQLNT